MTDVKYCFTTLKQQYYSMVKTVGKDRTGSARLQINYDFNFLAGLCSSKMAQKQFLDRIFKSIRGKQGHLLVFGWCRIENKSISKDSGIDIPEVIMIECLKYYFRADIWDINAYSKDKMIVEVDTITMISNNTNASAYLTELASEGLYVWRFKIMKQTHTNWNQSIGIWKVNADNNPPLDDDFCVQSGAIALTNTGFIERGWSLSKGYGARYKEKDIVEMTLDFDNKELRFKINDIDYGKAAGIKDGNQYRAGISLYYAWDAIQLL